MSDLPRDKYEILDFIFTFLFAISMVLTALFLLNNLIVSSIFIIVIVLFSLIYTFSWIARNPFNMYLVRTFGLTNFLITFISLILFSYRLSDTLPRYFSGLIFLLFPSGIYLVIAIIFSSISLPLDKRTGARLVFYGKIKNVEIGLFGESLEDRKRRNEAIAQLKIVYRYKIIIVLSIVFILSSFAALIIGSY